MPTRPLRGQWPCWLTRTSGLLMVRAKAAPAKAGWEHEPLSVLPSDHKNTPDVIGQVQTDSGAIGTTHLLSLVETATSMARIKPPPVVPRLQPIDRKSHF